MVRIAVYPGTFDPVTNGHIDILERASGLFDEIIIGIAEDNYKNTLFTLEERLYLMKESVGHLKNVSVESFTGLSVEYAVKKNAQALLRGLRVVSDFEYEMQVATINKHLNDELETVFLMTSDRYAFLSSSIVKQVASLGGRVTGLVPPLVEESLKKKYGLSD